MGCDMDSNTPDKPDVISPPPLIYFGLIVGGFLFDSLWRLPLHLFPLQRVVGIVIVVVGFGLSLASILQFVRHGTHPDPSKPSTTLITTGPYRYSRNPIYLAYSLMHFGIALWATKAWLLITLPFAVALIRFGVVIREEEYLERRFGESYLQYKNSVRRWLGLRTGSGERGAGSGTFRPMGQ